MTQMLVAEAEYVLALKGFGVLGDSCAHSNEYSKGLDAPKSIYWGCPDCDVLMRKMKHHGRAKEQLLHPIGPEGGGISVSPHSPIWNGHKFPLDHYVHRILLVSKVKQTRSISLYSHVPCGAARLAELTVPQMIELTLVGRGVLTEKLTRHGDFEIVPYLHANWGDLKENGPETDNTYMISQEAWMDVRSQYWHELKELHNSCILTVPYQEA